MKSKHVKKLLMDEIKKCLSLLSNTAPIHQKILQEQESYPSKN